MHGWHRTMVPFALRSGQSRHPGCRKSKRSSLLYKVRAQCIVPSLRKTRVPPLFPLCVRVSCVREFSFCFSPNATLRAKLFDDNIIQQVISYRKSFFSLHYPPHCECGSDRTEKSLRGMYADTAADAR